MIDPKLEDKVVLVTGANHGIGAATAVAFAAQGAKVFVTSFRDQPRFSQDAHTAALEKGSGGPELYEAMQQQSPADLIEKIRRDGGVASAYEADLAEAANIPLLFDLCEQQLGSVDILVNNHTYCVLETLDPDRVTSEGFLVSLPTADVIDAHFVINARAYTLMMSEYVQRYLAREATWGRIINVSTDAAHAHESNISYAASKHAIESYTRSAAIELGKYGITVNILSPGPIQTGYITPESELEIAAGTPLGRVGMPDDIADVMVFLASEQAQWLTGQLLYVGGGWRMGQ
jgi:3-oxoacyl-[acyl-carrier protein] reductase